MSVTKKLPSGGLHTKFHSSSSSSSNTSSSSSESSSASSQQPASAATKGSKAPSRPATQWDVKKAAAPLPFKASKPRAPTKAVAAVQPAKPAAIGGSEPVKPARARRRRGGARKGKGTNIAAVGGIIGGPGDVLSTKSLVFTSPVGKVSNIKVVDIAASGNRNKKTSNGDKRTAPSLEAPGGVKGAEDGGGDGDEQEEQRSVEGAEESTEDAASHARMSGQSALPLNANDLECSGSAEPAKDYSGFAALQGMPRVGDKLAFKVIANSVRSF